MRVLIVAFLISFLFQAHTAYAEKRCSAYAMSSAFGYSRGEALKKAKRGWARRIRYRCGKRVRRALWRCAWKKRSVCYRYSFKVRKKRWRCKVGGRAGRRC